MITIHLSEEDIDLALTIARKRTAAGASRWEDSPSGNLTPEQVEFMGMLGEIAAARHYGVEPDTKIYTRRADAGPDLRVGNYSADVKATNLAPDPAKPKQPHLFVPHKNPPYDAYISAYVVEPMDQGVVQLLGCATRNMVLAYPYRPFALGRLCRAVPNNALLPIRTNDALKPSNPKPRLAAVTKPPIAFDQAADYLRCHQLLKAIDVPNGVRVPALGKRGTLINAQISLSGYPPGVRVVLEGEEEIVPGSDTRKNPAGTPISRNFYSADVKVVGQ